MSRDAISYMREALALARTNLGQTWPNPAVGALIVKDNHIIGRGCTARGGRPHAEPVALAEAGDAARGATLYVTLEPCSHHGKTPPCAEAVIAAGIARVVIACGDPNPLVNGDGIGMLREAGIEVEVGICESEARELNRGFISVMQRNRPYVAMKIATSLDEKIAYPQTPSLTLPPSGREDVLIPSPACGGGLGRGPWITGESSRREVHRLRSEYDAILTGIGTVLTDDPMLNVRIPGLENKSPVRIVLDRHHRLPNDSQITKTAQEIPTWILHQSDLESALDYITRQGITRLLVEAGQGINTAFLLQDW